MNPYNLLRGAVLTLMLIGFLVVPQKTFAVDFNFFNFTGEEDYQILSEFESKRILQDFSDKLYDKWEKLTVNGYSDPMEKTVICLLKEITMLNMWNYFFRDLPLDVSFNVAKQSVEIAKLVGTEDTSGILGKIEKETAKAAVKYLKEYFFKNQIKVSFGAMEVKYKTEIGSVDSPFQYIIMYKSIDENRGKVVARIYSPKEIIPPPSRGSLGMVKGFLNSLDSGQNISPFIVEINGEMKKGMYGSYLWDGTPEIKTVFPQTVPDFGLRPRTWQEKYIINPIKETIDNLGQLFGIFSGGKTAEFVDYVLKDSKDQEKIDAEVENIKSGKTIEEQYPPKEEKKETVVSQKKEPEKVIEKTTEKKEEKKEEILPVAICSKNSSSSISHNIIFNEIAWMGSKNSTNDEWIELKNISGKDIDLKGYTISDKGEKIKIVFGSQTIPNGGFLLLERTDDSTVPFKSADLIYQGALSNKDEELYLFDGSCNVEDYVSANPDWPSGDNAEKRTMERMNDLSWLTYSGDGLNNIWGTPKEANSPGKKKEEKKEPVNNQSSGASLAISGGGSIPANAVSYCSQSNLPSPTHQVIINEIAWMGTETSHNDEWIELKNVSEETVNLNNWQLLDKDNQIKVVFSSSDIIDSGGFLLLERTNNDTVPNILSPDRNIFSGYINDSNESLRLFNSGCVLIDEVVANPDWSAGDKVKKKTMERSDGLNWHTYSSLSVDPVSGLWGTPRAENSLEVLNSQEEPQQDEVDLTPDEEPVVDNVNLLITEIQVNGEEGHEYVELFNQSEEEISLCSSEEDCYYFSYYPSDYRWADPRRNWKFLEGEVLSSNSYYIIDVFGESGGDWRLETMEETEGEHYYASGQLNNSYGSLVLFSGNPKYSGDEEKTEDEQEARVISLKIDAIGWSNDDTVPVVKEGQAFVLSEREKVMGRKWVNGEYADSDDNLNDFQLEVPSPRSHAPKPPSPVDDLLVALNPEQKNSAMLSWTIPEDEDTESENIDYEIYYSRNGQIDESNLLNIEGYVDVEIASGENDIETATISDLYYSSDYVFAVKAKDPEGNYSLLSNNVSFSIEEAVHQKPAAYYDFKRSNRSNFAGPINENLNEAVVFAQGADGGTGNDDFSSPVAIDENGTVYFRAKIDGVWGIYAYTFEGKKWGYECQSVCDEPFLGKDGSIYFSSEKSVYTLSPSGKLEWKVDFEKVYTKNIIIDSEGSIYFIASEELNNAILFAFDGEEKTPIYTLGDLRSVNYPELIIDDGNNIFLSIDSSVFKFKLGEGKIAERSFPVGYHVNYLGEQNKTSTAEQVHISFDGNILVNIYQGWCESNGSQIDVFYAMDNDLNNILWERREYGSVSSVGENEFYFTALRRGPPNYWDVVAVDLSDGNIKWTKWWRGEGTFSPLSFVASDSGGNVYLTQSTEVVGYNSSNILGDNDEHDNDKILSFLGAEPSIAGPLSIGQGVMYIPKVDKIMAVKY